MRSRPLIVVAVVALLALLPVAPVGAATDAPNTCTGATTTKPLNTWIVDGIEPSGDIDWFRFTTGANRYALVTLGKLAANYTLELYSSCGTKLATSARSGVQYEEIYRYLPAGTYRVRVSGVSGAHSATTYVLRFRTLAAGVLVLSYRTWTEPGKLFVVGELLNNTGQTRKWVKALVKFYDSSNNQIGATYFTYSLVHLMKPRTRSPFGPPYYFPIPAGYHHHTVTTDPGTVTTDVPVGKLKVTPGTPYTTSWGTRHYPGTLTNNNDFALSEPQVLLTLYSDRGNVLNADFTYPGAVGAGATIDFDCTLFDHYSGVNRYVFQAEGEP